MCVWTEFAVDSVRVESSRGQCPLYLTNRITAHHWCRELIDNGTRRGTGMPEPSVYVVAKSTPNLARQIVEGEVPRDGIEPPTPAFSDRRGRCFLVPWNPTS